MKDTKTISPSDRISAVEAAVESGMSETGSQGLAYALILDGKIVSTNTFGYRNAKLEPLTVDTIMYGASLTKTAFAYTVAQFVDEGLLDLDESIAAYLPKPLPEMDVNARLYAPYTTLDDERWREITPRMLLTHSAGFHNFWFLEPDRKLHIHFKPGSRYAYSGDGFVLLQYFLEQGLGLNVGAEMDSRIFQPLGMSNTDMMWRDDFAENLADGWTIDGESVPHDDRSKVRASGSMDTTITDMAKFAAALVTCHNLSSEACQNMFARMVPITTPSQFPSLIEELPASEQTGELAAALGSVSFDGPQGPGIFKGGHNDNTGNMMVCLKDSQDCIVLLSNDVRSEAAFPSIVRAGLGETGIPWTWEYSDKALIP